MKARIPKGAGPSNMMDQLRRVQENMASKQAELDAAEYEIKAGGGLVSLVMTGTKQIKQLTISPDIVDPEDIETLADLITAAVNEAVSTVDETTAREMEAITGALNLPGMPGGLGR